MASYGVYRAACGFEYHGPMGHIGFVPKLAPENFRATFTCAEGWGTFAQKRAGRRLAATVDVRWGRLRLRSLALELPAKAGARQASVKAGARVVQVNLSREGRRILLTFASDVQLETGQRLEIDVAY